jgi:hydrogenase-4 component E
MEAGYHPARRQRHTQPSLPLKESPMALSSIDLIAAAVAVLAVWMCGVTRVRAQLWGISLQTALLAVICLVLGLRPHAEHYLTLAATVLLIKALAIPAFLMWSARRLEITHDNGAIFSPTLALFAASGILAAAYFMAPQISVPSMNNAGAAGVSLALLLTGMLLMITRRLALSQIIGFLVLENGIFLYGLTQTHGIPLLLEMGIAFEVLVAVMVAGLVIHRLNRSFEHVDVTQLRGLRN